jgi:hypothetical protein
MSLAIESPRRAVRMTAMLAVFPWILFVGIPCIFLLGPLLIMQLIVMTWKGDA